MNVLWYNRLEHVPFVKMKNIVSIPASFSSKQPFLCSICPMARQERLPFPQKTSITTKVFELLYVDLWGPYHVTTHDNYRYFITIVDDYSRSTWTQLLSCNSNALQTIKAFVILIENQFNIRIKIIRSDNGLEFTNTKANLFFQSKGIVHQRTCPYTPQQNGIVERKHKYLLETARALLFQSKLPTRYWGECIICATYIINRLPSSSLNNRCPYELLYKRKPKYSQMRSFGCLCYPTVPKPHRDKFEPRTTPHVFVGYPFNTKGYKVLNLATKKIHISRDVAFNEYIFPFAMHDNTTSFPSVLNFIPFIDHLEVEPKQHTSQHRSSVTQPTGPLESSPATTSHDQLPTHSSSPPMDSYFHTQNNSTTNNPTPPMDLYFHTQNDSVPNSSVPLTSHVGPRKSLREPKTPVHLKDYIHYIPNLKPIDTAPICHANSFSLNALFSNHNSISTEALTHDSQALVRNICHDR